MKCPICGRNMSYEKHTAGNTDSKWGDRALAVATVAGSIFAGAIFPGPGHAMTILGCRAAGDLWSHSSNNYELWTCKHCGHEIRK